jgi:hypothetical protein
MTLPTWTTATPASSVDGEHARVLDWIASNVRAQGRALACDVRANYLAACEALSVAPLRGTAQLGAELRARGLEPCLWRRSCAWRTAGGAA